MKIGILSDTHSKLDKAKTSLDILIKNGAEFIVHAGDIGGYEILELLKNSGKTYIAVYGNNDAHLVEYHNDFNLVKEPYYFKIADTKFKLMHLPYYMSPDSDVVIFGHTHQFEVDLKNNTLFINPGESCARNKPLSECALLDINENSYIVTYYSKEKISNNFTTQVYSFKRDSNG
jgi:uncharacterized protein